MTEQIMSMSNNSSSIFAEPLFLIELYSDSL